MIAMMLFPACSDDDPVAPPQSVIPSQETLSDAVDVKLPQNLIDSNEPQAQAIEDAMKEVDGELDTWMSMFGEPDGPPVAEKSGKWTYTWTWTEESNDLTLTLVIEDTDTEYSYTLSISGTLSGETIKDVVFYEARALKNGKSGWVHLRDPKLSLEEWHFKWTWNTDTAGNFTMSLESKYPKDECKIDFAVNADGSGRLSEYDWNGSKWVITSLYTWSANGGGGTYTEYDQYGNPTGNGNWGNGGGGGSDIPVAPAGMEGTWSWNSIETDCNTSQNVYESGTDIICEGEPFIEEENTGFLPCEVFDVTSSSFRVECSTSYTYEGCVVKFSITMDVTYSNTTVTMDGRSSISHSGTGCEGEVDECYDISITGTRTGDAPAGACGGPIGKAALSKWLVGKIQHVRP